MKSIRNLFRFGLLSFMIGCCAGGALQDSHSSGEPQQSSRVQEIERLRQLTVALVATKYGIAIPYCAGVWVDENVVLTAAHCVDDPEKIQILVSTREDYENMKGRSAVVFAKDAQVDLALLYIDPEETPNHPVALLSQKTMFAGDEVDIIGHTMGFDWTYSHGYVAAVRDDMPGPDVKLFKKALQISGPIWMGNSGGGAFDSTGRLVGISSWVAVNAPEISFFVHVDLIESFMIKEMMHRPN